MHLHFSWCVDLCRIIQGFEVLFNCVTYTIRLTDAGTNKVKVCWASIIFTCVPQSNIMCNKWCFSNLQLLHLWLPCTLPWYHMHLLTTTWIKSYQGASSADTKCSKPADIANSSNSELGICPTAFNFEGLSPVFKGLIETSPDVGVCLVNLLLHLWMSIDLSCFLSLLVLVNSSRLSKVHGRDIKTPQQSSESQQSS